MAPALPQWRTTVYCSVSGSCFWWGFPVDDLAVLGYRVDALLLLRGALGAPLPPGEPCNGPGCGQDGGGGNTRGVGADPRLRGARHRHRCRPVLPQAPAADAPVPDGLLGR